MKRMFWLLCLMLVLVPMVVFAHPGNTDSDGGHYNNSTGEYHYHHGYPEHNHWDMDGDGDLDCPYFFDDKTGQNSGSSLDGTYKSVYWYGRNFGYNDGYDDGQLEGYQNGYERAEQVLEKEKQNAILITIGITILVCILFARAFFTLALMKERDKHKQEIEKIRQERIHTENKGKGQTQKTSNLRYSEKKAAPKNAVAPEVSNATPTNTVQSEIDINTVMTCILVLITGGLLTGLCFLRDPNLPIGFRGFGEDQITWLSIIQGLIGYLFVGWLFCITYWTCLAFFVVYPVAAINAAIKKLQLPRKAQYPGVDHGFLVAQYCSVVFVVAFFLLAMFGFIGF